MEEFMKLVAQYLRPELIIVSVVIYGIGLLLAKVEKVWSVISSWYPLIALGLAEVLTILYVCAVLGEGWSAVAVVTAIVQGLLVACVSVFGHEVIDNLASKLKK